MPEKKIDISFNETYFSEFKTKRPLTNKFGHISFYSIFSFTSKKLDYFHQVHLFRNTLPSLVMESQNIFRNLKKKLTVSNVYNHKFRKSDLSTEMKICTKKKNKQKVPLVLPLTLRLVVILSCSFSSVLV